MSSVDFRRETDWKVIKKFFPVYLEMSCDVQYADDIYQLSNWRETIETRKIAKPNNGSMTIYRKLGSSWDFKSGKRPPRPTPIPKKK